MLLQKIRRFLIAGLKEFGRYYILNIGLLAVFLTGCQSSEADILPIITEDEEMETGESIDSSLGEYQDSDEESTDTVYEKGYDLPIEEVLQTEAEEDCLEKMEMIRNMYASAEKGEGVNVYIEDETAEQMMDVLKETGQPVTANRAYMNMRNYEKIEQFLQDCEQGTTGTMILYEIHSAGGVGRKQFRYDGTDMYVLDTIAVWNSKDEPVISYTSFDRIKEWEYTQKGWFSYEYCVKEPPEVTEIIIGEVLVRVKPQPDEYNEIGKKYLYPIGYQGNNLFTTSWDDSQIENIDFTGLYEYLYGIEYATLFPVDNYTEGIPKQEFESILTKYLPVTAKQLLSHSEFQEAPQTYCWRDLNCGNYDPGLFGTAFPEIVDMQENADGTVTFLIDAVCEMMGDDAVMQHQLTVNFLEDGSIRYLKNEVLPEGIENIPKYQYRLQK